MLPRLILPAVAVLLAGTVSPSAMPMNGTFSMHYDKQSPQPVAPDHVKIDESGTGLNRSPGQPLDNAQVAITETVTLVKGQGPVTGVITFTTPNGTTSSPYKGKVTTDPQGRMTAVGRFRVANATGAFAGLKGSGSFATTFTSQTDQTTEWKGSFKPPAAMSATR